MLPVQMVLKKSCSALYTANQTGHVPCLAGSLQVGGAGASPTLCLGRLNLNIADHLTSAVCASAMFTALLGLCFPAAHQIKPQHQEQYSSAAAPSCALRYAASVEIVLRHAGSIGGSDMSCQSHGSGTSL